MNIMHASSMVITKPFYFLNYYTSFYTRLKLRFKIYPFILLNLEPDSDSDLSTFVPRLYNRLTMGYCWIIISHIQVLV